MTQQATCPSKSDLEQFLGGRLAVAQSEEMATHFLHCARCLETVHNLNANDTLTESLRGQSGTAVPGNPMLQELIRRLKTLPPASEEETMAAPPRSSSRVANDHTISLDGCDFLAPAEGPGEIGRLGTYRILKVLGQGGMGMVFEAEDARLKRRVALKVMRPSVAASPAARQRFLREAQAAATLTHDHVVTIYQVDEVGDVPFMAMQVLVGEALDERLKREQRLPLAEVLRIGRETAEGLAAAHEAGLIHRDIKPGNLWLESPRGRVKVLDFGLARAASDNTQLTQSGAIVGTPAYMAPEQARSDKVDGRCDLFSLGCILYRMCTGEAPFKGTDTISLLAAIALDVPKPPRQLNPDIPKPLDDLILQLLAKKPQERPASARIVAERLDAIAQGPSAAARAVPPSRRRWLVVATAAAFLAGLIALTVVILRDKHGKEVARFNLPDGGSVEVKNEDGKTEAPVTPARPDKEKPFVLARKGVETGAFKMFATLWDMHQPGDEIVVYGNGPFRLPHVDIKDQTLVVKAAPGFRPVFIPDESLFEKPQGWFLLQNGGLTVEGCDFLMRGAPPGRRDLYLIGGGDKPCVLGHCRFIGFYDFLVRDFRSSALTLEHCLILAGHLSELPARCELTLTNNLICCGDVVSHFWAPGGQKLRLTRNAFVSANAGVVPKIDPGVTNVTVTAEGNLIDGWPITKEGFKGQLNWQGKDNCYVHLKKGLAGWNAELTEPETNSREVPALPFGWLTEMPPGEAKQALAWWKTHLAEARQESGLNDLGPDLSLVGPGEAYLRGLADEGRPVSKEQLRPDPLPGGRVVLIRGGKDFRGFFLLQDALNAVQDGDVLEIRTDAALLGGRTPADRGALVVRAAAGYRPVIHTPLDILHGTAIAVEGLAFSDDGCVVSHWDKKPPPEKQGRVTRLAYCAFDRRRNGNPVLGGLVSGRDGSPGEVHRCVMLGRVDLYTAKGTQIRLRECLLGANIRRSPVDNDATGAFQLDRCALTSPQHTVGNQGLINDVCWRGTPKSQWTVRRCLLESNGMLLPGNIPPGWTGERNLYRFAPNWAGDQNIHGLVQWRAQMNSPETGSVEGLPPIADPRTWKLPPGIVPNGAGPDVDKVARRAKESAAAPVAIVDAPWHKQVAALPPAKQVEAVAARLKERNPGFDGKVTLDKIEDSMVTEIKLSASNVTDISPLQALVGLKVLSFRGGGGLSDLSPLKDMKLTHLDCGSTKVSDLSPLKDMKLTHLDCGSTKVSDLSPLKGMKLTFLSCGKTGVSDLSPLKGMPLTYLDCDFLQLFELSPLKGMPLTQLRCRKTNVSDLSPLIGMPLTYLDCRYSMKVSDLSPLKDMKLMYLDCDTTLVSDLSPLKDMKLTHLDCNYSKVSDLSPLKDMKLSYLSCAGTKVTDLSPLKDMKLTFLSCAGTKVTDLSPLKGMPLTSLFCDFKIERHAETLRSIETLKTINNKPAQVFWKEVEAKDPNRNP